MDSTHVLPLNSSPSKPKLPIKRKTITLHSFSSSSDAGPTPPPFKFHRIWTESDEIRFLRGLLDSASDGLVFPRDLSLFYHRFSRTMSQPYTKSQLSEKLRRLRKKFRLISSRLARGLHVTTLSPHDRVLYDLSQKLWSSEFSSISPFRNPGQEIPNSGKIKVENDLDVDDDDVDGDGKLGEVAARAVMDVFDECVREARMSLVLQGVLCHQEEAMSISSSKERKMVDFVKRWEEQHALELDVFASRLRLKLETSLHRN